MRYHFLVLARDSTYVGSKMKELSLLGVPYLVVCGEKVSDPRVVHRSPRGKFDAINFGVGLLPKDVDTIVFNDVDTRIHNFEAALSEFRRKKAALLFVKVIVKGGPQSLFYLIQDKIRRRFLIVADGELMLIQRKLLEKVLPLKPCKAEDTYILFNALGRKEKAVFCESCYCLTTRTSTLKEEESYKRRTVGGVYQALSYTKPPLMIKLFYVLLPFVSPVLLILGPKGFHWMKGILQGFVDYLRGDRGGSWKPSYVSTPIM